VVLEQLFGLNKAEAQRRFLN
jgi:hypothetical protein